mmetsp:Transcript_62032/g.134559  ORF Transcript_62032/g.134559 Transcript_62032/m.134559 type:complete len:1185 (-) Transcript_62032:155-3709(-)
MEPEGELHCSPERTPLQERELQRLPRHSSPRTKKPRVSFATVSISTFASGCEDPKKLSSPQERMLSPLVDTSVSSDEKENWAAGATYDEDSTFEVFPNLAALCATPEESKKRSSTSSELGALQRGAARFASAAASPPAKPSAREKTGSLPRSPPPASSSSSPAGKTCGRGSPGMPKDLIFDMEDGTPHEAIARLPGGTVASHEASRASLVTPERCRRSEASMAISTCTHGETPSDLTAQISLNRLVLEDEVHDSIYTAGGHHRMFGNDPVLPEAEHRSGGCKDESSDWDLFEQFKKSGQVRRSSGLPVQEPWQSALSSSSSMPSDIRSSHRPQVCSRKNSREELQPGQSPRPMDQSGHGVDEMPHGMDQSPPELAGNSSMRWGSGSDSPAEGQAGDACSEGVPDGGVAMRRVGSEGSPTVDVAPLLGATAKRAGELVTRTPVPEEDSAVPEGRKSFANQLPTLGRAGALQEARLRAAQAQEEAALQQEPVPSPGVAALRGEPLFRSPDEDFAPLFPTEPLGPKAINFEQLNREFEKRVGLAPGPGCKSDEAESSRGVMDTCPWPTGGHAPGVGGAAAGSAPGLGLLARVGALTSIARCSISSQRFSAGGRRSLGGAAGELAASGSLLPSPDSGNGMLRGHHSPESAPLPGASSLQPIRGALLFSGAGRGSSSSRLPFHEFLERCEVRFPPAQTEGPQTGSTFPDISSVDAAKVDAPMGCPNVVRAMEVLNRQRAAGMQRALEGLNSRTALTIQQYSMSLQRWDTAEALPAAAEELLKAQGNELDQFRARMDVWKTFCKEEAWLKWYTAKRQWLQQDLDLAHRHTCALRQEVNGLREALHRLQETSSGISAVLRQQQHLAEIRQTSRRLRDRGSTDLKTTQEEGQLLQQQVSELVPALDAERLQTEELERELAAVKSAAERDRAGVREARRAYLQQRAARALAERRRATHTCSIISATNAAVQVQLRGGACIRVEPAVLGADDPVRVTFQLPRSCDDVSGIRLAELNKELFARAWRRVAKGLADTVDWASSVTLEYKEVPRLLRQLDASALRICDQLGVLRSLRKECPEVTRIEAGLVNDGARNPFLAVAATLLVVRSHTTDSSGLLVLLDPSTEASDVDVAECLLEFGADLDAFPDIKWRETAVHQVRGLIDTEAVMHVLQSATSCDSCGEVLAAVAGVVRRQI